jgi:hypothetical protein
MYTAVLKELAAFFFKVQVVQEEWTWTAWTLYMEVIKSAAT